MRKLPIFLVAFLVTAVGAARAETEIAPDWSLVTPGGATVTLSEEVQEQTTVLLFWATWCPYCRALMPHLQSMRLEYGEQIKILAINVFEDGDPVEFVEIAGYDFTLLLEGDDVAEDYGVSGTPGLFIVDRKRLIRFDLASVPRIDPPDTGEEASNRRKAAYRAPYWAAEIRKRIDAVLTDAP